MTTEENKNFLMNASIAEKIEWVKKRNIEYSNEFIAQQVLRRFYRGQHSTEIAAFKCMDGRINIPIVTEIPLGIIQPFRNLAGKFDLGWPYLGELVSNWVDYSVSKGRQCLILITYHFSRGNNAHRGCAGFDYDKEAAFNFTINFKAQFERMFGKDNQVIFPIIVGLETDSDALIFHGDDPKNFLDLSALTAEVSDDELGDKIRSLYPSMPRQVVDDVLPLVQGNISHIEKIKLANRPILDSEHREWILGIGRGFDWLHEPNTALLIGPYSPNLSEPIEIAAKIIKDNMEHNRISKDGFILLASAPFREMGYDRNRAIEKAGFLSNFAQSVIKAKYPELVEIMHPLSCILNLNSRKMKLLDEI